VTKFPEIIKINLRNFQMLVKEWVGVWKCVSLFSVWWVSWVKVYVLRNICNYHHAVMKKHCQPITRHAKRRLKRYEHSCCM